MTNYFKSFDPLAFSQRNFKSHLQLFLSYILFSLKFRSIRNSHVIHLPYQLQSILIYFVRNKTMCSSQVPGNSESRKSSRPSENHHLPIQSSEISDPKLKEGQQKTTP